MHAKVNTLNRLNNEPGDENPDGDDAYEGTQHLTPMIAKAVLLVRLPARGANREYADDEREAVGQHVSGVGHNCYGVGYPAADELGDHEKKTYNGDLDELIQCL